MNFMTFAGPLSAAVLVAGCASGGAGETPAPEAILPQEGQLFALTRQAVDGGSEADVATEAVDLAIALERLPAGTVALLEIDGDTFTLREVSDDTWDFNDTGRRIVVERAARQGPASLYEVQDITRPAAGSSRYRAAFVPEGSAPLITRVTGSATYTGPFRGLIYSDNANVYTLEGSVSIDLDFGESVVDVAMTSSLIDASGPEGTVTGRAADLPLAAAAYAGTMTLDSPDLGSRFDAMPATLSGRLLGSAAEATGGTVAGSGRNAATGESFQLIGGYVAGY